MAGGILVHEGGHALTVWSLGGVVQRFRPFPSQVPALAKATGVSIYWYLAASLTTGYLLNQ